MTFVADLKACPDCGEQWKHTTLDGREYSDLIGVYDRGRDMTVAWQCPGCGHQWPRGAGI